MRDAWNRGAPPHDGWWSVRTSFNDKEGEFWSFFCGGMWHCIGDCEDMDVEDWAMLETGWGQLSFEWCYFYPENARVPRIDPRSPANL